MFFKFTYSIRGLNVRDEADLPASVSIDDSNRVILRIRQFDHNGRSVKQLCADLVADRVPPARAADTLRALRRNILLLDQPLQKGLPYESLDGPIVDERGQIKEKWRIPFALLPKGARPWLSELHRDIGEMLKEYIQTLRWRQAASCGHRPFAFVSFDWSDDGNEWSYVPTIVHVSVSTPASVNVNEACLREAALLLASGEGEPFAHELIREAGELVSSAPRSSLLVSLAALETALKDYLSFLIPDGALLIENLPSPSVIVLLRDVIPAIHKSKGIISEYIPLSQNALDLLKKWVAQRNQVAHGVKKDVDTEGLRDLIRVVSDILYVLDACRGNNWASKHVVDI